MYNAPELVASSFGGPALFVSLAVLLIVVVFGVSCVCCKKQVKETETPYGITVISHKNGGRDDAQRADHDGHFTTNNDVMLVQRPLLGVSQSGSKQGASVGNVPLQRALPDLPPPVVPSLESRELPQASSSGNLTRESSTSELYATVDKGIVQWRPVSNGQNVKPARRLDGGPAGDGSSAVSAQQHSTRGSVDTDGLYAAMRPVDEPYESSVPIEKFYNSVSNPPGVDRYQGEYAVHALAKGRGAKVGRVAIEQNRCSAPKAEDEDTYSDPTYSRIGTHPVNHDGAQSRPVLTKGDKHPYDIIDGPADAGRGSQMLPNDNTVISAASSGNNCPHEGDVELYSRISKDHRDGAFVPNVSDAVAREHCAPSNGVVVGVGTSATTVDSFIPVNGNINISHFVQLQGQPESVVVADVPTEGITKREPSYRYISVRESLETLRARMAAEAGGATADITANRFELRNHPGHYYATISEHSYETLPADGENSPSNPLYEDVVNLYEDLDMPLPENENTASHAGAGTPASRHVTRVPIGMPPNDVSTDDKPSFGYTVIDKRPRHYEAIVDSVAQPSAPTVGAALAAKKQRVYETIQDDGDVSLAGVQSKSSGQLPYREIDHRSVFANSAQTNGHSEINLPPERFVAVYANFQSVGNAGTPQTMTGVVRLQSPNKQASSHPSAIPVMMSPTRPKSVAFEESKQSDTRLVQARAATAPSGLGAVKVKERSLSREGRPPSKAKSAGASPTSSSASESAALSRSGSSSRRSQSGSRGRQRSSSAPRVRLSERKPSPARSLRPGASSDVEGERPSPTRHSSHNAACMRPPSPAKPLGLNFDLTLPREKGPALNPEIRRPPYAGASEGWWGSAKPSGGGEECGSNCYCHGRKADRKGSPSKRSTLDGHM